MDQRFWVQRSSRRKNGWKRLVRKVICRTVMMEDESLSCLLHTIKAVVIQPSRTSGREKKRAAPLRGTRVTPCIILVVLVQLQANLSAHPLTEKSLSCSTGEAFSMLIHKARTRSSSAEITAIIYSLSHLAVPPSLWASFCCVSRSELLSCVDRRLPAARLLRERTGDAPNSAAFSTRWRHREIIRLARLWGANKSNTFLIVNDKMEWKRWWRKQNSMYDSDLLTKFSPFSIDQLCSSSFELVSEQETIWDVSY